MTAARRLAAIMAIDVVGYSRLMGEEESGIARAVREHCEAVRGNCEDDGATWFRHVAQTDADAIRRCALDPGCQAIAIDNAGILKWAWSPPRCRYPRRAKKGKA